MTDDQLVDRTLSAPYLSMRDVPNHTVPANIHPEDPPNEIPLCLLK